MERKIKGLVLASVFDKRGIQKFAGTLVTLGYSIISSEGTGNALSENGIDSIPAQKISGNPDGLDGCIKTISFRIEAGILYDRSNSVHCREAEELGIKPIDIVICNFPPLEEVLIEPGTDFNIRNIDVGGPLMVRAAATNFRHVLVVVDPDDYDKVAKAISENNVTNELRQRLAEKAFGYTGLYDQKILEYLRENEIPPIATIGKE